MSSRSKKSRRLPRPNAAAVRTRRFQTLDDLLACAPDKLPQVDIAEMNLLCVQGLPGAESLDIDRCLRTLDHWAKHVRFETKRHAYRVTHPRYAAHYKRSPARFKMEMLVQTLQEDFSVRYNAQRIHHPDFTNAKDLFIHGMIDDGNGGTCASMPVLYLAVARRLGYPMRLVSAKAHLFCRWEGKKERLNLDGAANGGCSFFEDEYYHRWPLPLTPAELASGEFLTSMSPSRELATFLASRGHCLQDNGDYRGAINTYRAAIKFDPHSRHYRGFLANLIREELPPRPSDMMRAWGHPPGPPSFAPPPFGPTGPTIHRFLPQNRPPVRPPWPPRPDPTIHPFVPSHRPKGGRHV